MMQDIKSWIFLPLAVFGIGQSLSLAVGNTLLIFIVISMLLYSYKHKDNIDIFNNKVVLSILLFVGIMFIAALISGDVVYSCKEWLNRWLWRLVPLVAILLFNNKELSEKLLFLGIIGYSIDAIKVVYQGLNGLPRANGFFGNPMRFAGFSCVCLPVLLIFVLDDKLLSKRERFLAGVLLILDCIALFCNGTRGAWLAVIAVFVVIGAYYLRKNMKLLLIVLLGIAILGGVGVNNKYFSQRLESMTSTTNTSNLERFRIWQASTRMFIDNPVLGIGTGRFEKEYKKKYVIRTGSDELGHSHNNVLHIFAEGGLVGAIAFFAMFFSMVKYGISEVVNKSNPYGLMLACAVTSLFLQGMTEYNIGQGAVSKFFWYNVACLLVLCSSYKKQE